MTDRTEELKKKLDRIERQLKKVRGCSPLTHGWQTQKYAKASRKWDELAKERMNVLSEIDSIETQQDMFYGDVLNP